MRKRQGGMLETSRRQQSQDSATRQTWRDGGGEDCDQGVTRDVVPRGDQMGGAAGQWEAGIR